MKPVRVLLCVSALGLMITFGGCVGDDEDTQGTSARTSARDGTSSVVAGIVEPDANYPWGVRLNGCGGVLIDPKWVLTAAHCVTPTLADSAGYKRTDPQSGVLSTERVGFHPRVGPGNNRGVFIHPEYDLTRNQPFDIALIRLAGAFEIQPMMQTVGLPTAPVVGGVVGNLANYRHNATLPEGHVAVFRAPMPP